MTSDTLKKDTMDKTLENTFERSMKTGINTKLPTCDDKGQIPQMTWLFFFSIMKNR